MKLPPDGPLMTTGADQFAPSSQRAALGSPPLRVSQKLTTTRTLPLGSGSSQLTYRRPYVGLAVELSMVIIGLSWTSVAGSPPGRNGSPAPTGTRLLEPAG